MPPPVPLIFDTDMSIDVDDVGALCVAHALADAGDALDDDEPRDRRGYDADRRRRSDRDRSRRDRSRSRDDGDRDRARLAAFTHIAAAARALSLHSANAPPPGLTSTFFSHSNCQRPRRDTMGFAHNTEGLPLGLVRRR